MPSRKQRRRREKAFRHEYETVLLDGEGNEVPLDPDEVRAEREAKQAERTKTKPAGKNGRATSARTQRTSRLTREPPAPSWQRAVKRGGTMGAIIFVLFVFILHGGSTANRSVIAALYGVAFIPMTYWIDRLSYRTYHRRLARQADKKKS